MICEGGDWEVASGVKTGTAWRDAEEARFSVYHRGQTRSSKEANT